MKKQLIFIRGGEAFDREEDFWEYLKNREYNPFDKHKSWRDWVGWALSDDFEIIEPNMPNKQYAQYRAWKIWFEKVFPYLNEEKLVMIGHSLGGLFLAKYVSENTFPKRISQLHLVAPVFDSNELRGEGVGDFMLDPQKLSNLQSQCDTIFIYQSQDDTTCPPHHGRSYAQHLPQALYTEFQKRGHFIQPAFPELLANITAHL
jgi:predicted alpha/beta hydrolase family esterase